MTQPTDVPSGTSANIEPLNPFPSDDPRHDLWVRFAGWRTEADAGLRAELLLKVQTESTENIPTWVLDLMTGRFDIMAQMMLTTIDREYRSAYKCEQALNQLTEVILPSFDQIELPPWIQKSEVRAELKIRLLQRSAHWSSKAFKLTREARDSVAGGATSTKPSAASSRSPEQPILTEAGQRGADDSGSVPATWQDVTIEFTSDERIQVKAATWSLTENYEGMGFENRTSGKPNLAWGTLRTLAENNGSIDVPLKLRKTLEKRAQEIRKSLRAYFVKAQVAIPAESDPLPYDKRTKTYAARFKLGLRPSYHS